MRKIGQWGVIFDWDGVLVDSGPLHRKAWERLAAELGKPLERGQFEESFGRKNQWIIGHLLRWADSPEEVEALSRRKEELYRELVFRDGVRLLPGVLSFVEELAVRSIPRAIATSTPRENLVLGLKSLGLCRYFSCAVTAEDVSMGKPDPEIFLRAAKQIDLPAGRCVVIEDAPAGVEGARRAGMRVVAVTTTHPEEKLRNADKVIPSPACLPVEELEAWFG
ncbi:HAD family hydrolase [Candidatus Methylacidithermus pantelleriae]|uniref:Glycoprotease n=1 Tax=Candidatus Methylacidithermus pantelleriae TaxID=2744239 RepID=A0A8J2BR62_9BACT|nr:HAD family phosphatase [Candidatus Methylacidithermus pantelleriae]CAF0705249.1 Glycoprotease [Candidatus Methylacidithermus pantelleriae]